jgi:CheY-like chemotaxis protein
MQKLANVLVVEDDIASLTILKMFLEDLDIAENITSCSHGQEALNYLVNIKASGSKYPEVIFLDIHMPVVDGFEFLEACHNTACLEGADTRVIILTSSALKTDLEKAKQFGISTYLIKPITTGGILFALQEAERDIRSKTDT